MVPAPPQPAVPGPVPGRGQRPHPRVQRGLSVGEPAVQVPGGQLFEPVPGPLIGVEQLGQQVRVGDPLAERDAERGPHRQHVIGGVGDEPAGRVGQHRGGGVPLRGVGHVQHPRLTLGPELHQAHREPGREEPRPVIIDRGGFHVQAEHRFRRGERGQRRRVQLAGPRRVHGQRVAAAGAQVAGHAASAGWQAGQAHSTGAAAGRDIGCPHPSQAGGCGAGQQVGQPPVAVTGQRGVVGGRVEPARGHAADRPGRRGLHGEQRRLRGLRRSRAHAPRRRASRWPSNRLP